MASSHQLVEAFRTFQFADGEHAASSSNQNLHDNNTLNPTCNIVTPVGMLGFGLYADHTAAALAVKLRNGAPTAIVLDSGSTDSGPEKLALGKMSTPREAFARDLKKLIKLSWQFRVPLIFSSAGGDGSDEHVEELTEIVREIVDDEKNESYRLKVISIFSGISKTLVAERLQRDMITGCGKPVPALTQQKIDATPRILAQIGPEPILDAMLANPDFDVIIAGRAYDPAPYIAFAAFASRSSLQNTSDPPAKHVLGGFAHMGKILECGGLCGVPKSNGAMATMYHNGTFDVTPLDPKSKCTAISVAAHTLYEKSRPDILHGPGGHLDLTGMKTKALDDGRSVRVSGGAFQTSRSEGLPYTVKLEGGEIVGYRAQMMGSIRDPILISQLDGFLERVKEYVAVQHEDAEGTWELDFHVYGQHHVSTVAPNVGQPAEIFLIGEALASTQVLATSVACAARVAITHGPYEGQKANSGSLAYGIGGQAYRELGPCAQFSVYHLMQLKEGEERLKIEDTSPGLFTQKVTTIGTPNPADVVRPPVPLVDPKAMDPKTIAISKSAGENQINNQLKSHHNPKTLGDISSLLRSKNAGPYEITLDVMFDSPAIYQLLKDSHFLNAKSMARLFDIREDDILWNGFFDQALAYKVTIPRLRKGKPTASGGYMENDVHASQQYIGLMNLALMEELVQAWKRTQKTDN